MSVLDRAALSLLPLLPRWLMRRLASRYIAGEELADALAKLAELRAQGFAGILDVLGEDVLDERAAHAVVDGYRTAATRIAAQGLDCYVSVKPTHVGLRLSEDLCFRLYDELARHCAGLRLDLRVEMEDHTTTDATLRVFSELRKSHDNVGVVLQARLFRTPKDIEALAGGGLDVRLVKGIYLEPEEIAHTEPGPIRDAFVACAEQLFLAGARVSLATHDDVMAERLFELVRHRELGHDLYEMQVLLGVREPLWEQWKSAGHPVRVYVPFGPQWRAYSQRRLRKNPQILRHVMRQTLGLG
jgi:proline dehydrogenase